MSVSDFLLPKAVFSKIPPSSFRRLYTLRLTSIVFVTTLMFLSIGCRNGLLEDRTASGRVVVTSDTILSGMVQSLLPEGHSDVSAILPSDQCPGHYDMKLSDIKKVEDADLIVSFRDLPFMGRAEEDPSNCILLDRRDRNWMAPDSYIFGLNILAGMLAERFPEEGSQIADRCKRAVVKVTEKAEALSDEIRRAGIVNQPVLASSMQRESLQWMGLNIIGEYGRPESMSARDVTRLSRVGREQGAVMVVDNVQSGPDAGRGIAEDLGVPHVVLSNFPSDKGYAATLGDNVAAVLAAGRTE